MRGPKLGVRRPSSFLDTLENVRISSFNYLNKQDDILTPKPQSAKSPFNIAYDIVYYIILIAKFVCNYVITFLSVFNILIYVFHFGIL